MNKNLLIIVSAAILIIVAGGAFYGGMLYGKSQNARTLSGANFQAFRGNRNGGNGGGFISGNIISKDSNSITLELPNNGGSKIIFYSGTTQINKFASGVANDLVVGTLVSVVGITNSDGSVTAQSIQIRPAGSPQPGQNLGQ